MTNLLHLAVSLVPVFTNTPDTNFYDLSWKPSTDTNVLGYGLAWGTNNSVFPFVQNMGTNLSGSLLTTNIDGDIYVVAFCWNGLGDFSYFSNTNQVQAAIIPHTNLVLTWTSDTDEAFETSPVVTGPWFFWTNSVEDSITIPLSNLPPGNLFFRSTASNLMPHLQ